MDLEDAFKLMCRIRALEDVAYKYYVSGHIRGFCHLYSGQEAIAAGMRLVMDQNLDNVITGYRDHGIMLSCGSCPKSILAELMGRQSGCSEGKGGSMHIFDLERNFYGGHGIVGSQVSLGTGMAFAHKYRNNQGVTFAYMGDGAVNQGQVYECFNMAALWKLPVLYIIENNQYGMGTSVERASAVVELYRKGEGSGVPGSRVDGMNILDVQKHMEESLAFVRSGMGPYILEMCTYRYRGHSMSDPGNYRTREEVGKFKQESDPINILKDHMLNNGILSEQGCDELFKAARKEMVQAGKEAFDSEISDPGSLFKYVY